MGTLVLSIGNTTVLGGVYSGRRLAARFRVPLSRIGTERKFAAVLGRLRQPVLRAAFCSVVPSLTAPASRAIRRRFHVDPVVLTAATPRGLAIGYRRPRELGTDRLAAALGIRVLFPRRDAIVVDCGTATTITVLRAGKILGGAILPGVGLWPGILAARTAQLPNTSGVAPRAAIGRSAKESIASGVFHGHAGAIRELVSRVRKEAFEGRKVLVVGTGGYAVRFAKSALFDVIEPDLVLQGLRALVETITP